MHITFYTLHTLKIIQPVTIGATLSFFNYAGTGTKDNAITTGSITFLYTEVSGVGRGISINNAFPISDTQGKAQTGDGKVFDFKVTSKTLKNTYIPYEVTARKSSNSTLDDSAVKLYLTKVNGSNEEEVLLAKYNDLVQTKKVSSDKYTEKTIYTGMVPANTTNYEQNFRLRMWIDEETDFSDGTMNNKSFTVTVNVYANGNLASNKQAPGLYNDEGVMIASWDTLVNQYGLDVERDYTYDESNNSTTTFRYISKTYGLDGTLVIPEGIEKIGSYALTGERNNLILDGLVLPSTLKSIGSYAIQSTNITHIEIPDSVVSMGTGIMGNNKSLTSAKLPSNLTEIPNGMFQYCSSIPSVGPVGSGAAVEIPSTVTKIDDYAFASSYVMEKIELPDSVTVIGKNAFDYAIADTVVLPSNLVSIGTNAFGGSDSVKCIKTIYVPSSVTTIGNNAFRYIHEVNYSGTATGSPWGAKTVVSDNTTYVVLNSSNYKYLGIESLSGDIVIPEIYNYEGQNYTPIEIASSAFAGNTEITSITLPNTITTIGAFAFNNAKNLKSINLPEGLVEIGHAAFQYTYALEEVSLPSTLKKIGQYAFNHSSSLNNTTIHIPASLEVIGDLQYPTHIFYDAGKDGVFTAFEIDSANPNYQVIDGILYTKDGSVLVAIPRGKTFTDNTYIMPDSVTTLGELSFSRNRNISKVIISDNLLIGGYDAREFHSYLNNGNTLSLGSYVYVPVSYYDVKDTNTNYKSVDGSLYTNDGTTLVAVPPFYNGALNIPEGVTTWQKEAMWVYSDVNKNVTSISIPSTLTNIDSDTLNYINNLVKNGQVTVTISEDNTTYKLNTDNTIVNK